MHPDFGQIRIPLGLEHISDVLWQGLTTASSSLNHPGCLLTAGFLERLTLRDRLEFTLPRLASHLETRVLFLESTLELLRVRRVRSKRGIRSAFHSGALHWITKTLNRTGQLGHRMARAGRAEVLHQACACVLKARVTRESLWVLSQLYGGFAAIVIGDVREGQISLALYDEQGWAHFCLETLRDKRLE